MNFPLHGKGRVARRLLRAIPVLNLILVAATFVPPASRWWAEALQFPSVRAAAAYWFFLSALSLPICFVLELVPKLREPRPPTVGWWSALIDRGLLLDGALVLLGCLLLLLIVLALLRPAWL